MQRRSRCARRDRLAKIQSLLESRRGSDYKHPEEIASGDEARYVEEEERAAKRIADDDPNYENT
jgi:hypothetical protein